jgi:hypothetical protein
VTVSCFSTINLKAPASSLSFSPPLFSSHAT